MSTNDANVKNLQRKIKHTGFKIIKMDDVENVESFYQRHLESFNRITSCVLLGGNIGKKNLSKLTNNFTSIKS